MQLQYVTFKCSGFMFAVCSVQVPLCSVQVPEYSVQCPVCSVLFTGCSVQFLVCSVQFVVCSMQCVLHVTAGKSNIPFLCRTHVYIEVYQTTTKPVRNQ